MDQQSFYQTGDTQLPKSYRGIIALLLIAVVVLGSIATVLGLLNIQLFHELNTQAEEAVPVQFAQLSSLDAQRLEHNANTLGLSIKTLSVFDQKFYHLPQGVYVTGVLPGSSAARQGVLPGDILTSVQNRPLSDANALEAYLSTCTQGQLLHFVIFRDGKQYTVYLMVGD